MKPVCRMLLFVGLMLLWGMNAVGMETEKPKHIFTLQNTNDLIQGQINWMVEQTNEQARQASYALALRLIDIEQEYLNDLLKNPSYEPSVDKPLQDRYEKINEDILKQAKINADLKLKQTNGAWNKFSNLASPTQPSTQQNLLTYNELINTIYLKFRDYISNNKLIENDNAQELQKLFSDIAKYKKRVINAAAYTGKAANRSFPPSIETVSAIKKVSKRLLKKAEAKRQANAAEQARLAKDKADADAAEAKRLTDEEAAKKKDADDARKAQEALKKAEAARRRLMFTKITVLTTAVVAIAAIAAYIHLKKTSQKLNDIGEAEAEITAEQSPSVAV